MTHRQWPAFGVKDKKKRKLTFLSYVFFLSTTVKEVNINLDNSLF